MIYTVESLAEYLKLNKQTIYNWVHKKKIPYLKLGGTIRFTEEMINEWLEEHIK